MKKITLLILLAFISISCKSKKEVTKKLQIDATAVKYANLINIDTAKEHVFNLASDEFEGRKTGESGQKKAAEYLASHYNINGIPKYLKKNYFQIIPVSELINKRRKSTSNNPSENVVAFIEGIERPEEVVVISSHYDHEGIKNGLIYNGADDNASGTTGVLLIAKAFAKAKKDGHGPKRSIMFVNFTAEEQGLLGSKYFIANPILPLENIVVNLNIDMIGRIGKDRQNDSDYIYVIGADRLSTELHEINERMNSKYTNIELDYQYNERNDPNRFYKRSDHYNFAKKGIPIAFYFNGTHEDYHKPTDTPDKILLDLLVKRVKLVFHTAWEIANRDERIAVDVEQEKN
ncbi:MAG: Zn-dependent M28 family amino/carboxypeptidase [Urechidicola sp.]|jgi:Zn-dependent M28 family amino/carboxypeptidase|tara:strand:+ start:2366 stop:3406 length:1041 start_codon:yes stop_codon:yes gene_type:complete